MEKSGRSLKGVRLSEHEKSRLVDLRRQGWTYAAIAKDLGRDSDTVRKYALQLGTSQEVEGLRREALKEAQVAHWRSLTAAAQWIVGKFTPLTSYTPDAFNNWDEPSLDNRTRYLLEALKEHHAADHPIWDLWGRWDTAKTQLHEACRSALEYSLELVTEDRAQEGIIVEAFRRELIGGWLANGAGQPATQPHIEELKGEDARGKPHRLYHSRTMIAWGTEDQVQQAMRLWKCMTASLTTGISLQRIRDPLEDLRELQPRIEQAAEQLELIEGFPGECQFCPLRSVTIRRRKRV